MEGFLSSFPLMLAILAFLYGFIFENLVDIIISYLKFNSNYYEKGPFVVKLISLVNASNLFSLEVIQNANFANFVY